MSRDLYKALMNTNLKQRRCLYQKLILVLNNSSTLSIYIVSLIHKEKNAEQHILSIVFRLYSVT